MAQPRGRWAGLNQIIHSELIEEIYATTVAPERFATLLGDWERYLSTSDGERAALAQPQVREHLTRAAQIFDSIWLSEPAADEPAPVIGGLYPWFECDAAGMVTDANRPAAALYAAKPDATLNSLKFTPEDRQRLQTALLQALQAQDTPQVISCDGIDQRAHTVVSVQRTGPRRVRFVTNDLVWTARLKEIVSSSFGLSRAESEIVQMLAEGGSVNTIAAERQSAVTTVRAQIRSIYDKTAVRNQAELLRLAIGIATIAHAEEMAQSAPATNSILPLAQDVRHLTLPDGRTLDYVEFGAQSGTPVLFLHDEYYGYHWSRGMVEHARQQHLRIIAPARGGYGQSDPYAEETDPTHQCCQDLLLLLDELGVAEFSLLTRRTGYRFGLQICHKAPGRIQKFIACAPALPARNAEDYASMNPLARFISLTTLSNPTLLAFVARAGNRFIQTQGLRQFARVINKACDVDLEIIENDGHWEVMEAGMNFSHRHGHRTYLKEAEHDTADVWDKTIRSPVPITLLIGELDPNARLARAEALNAAGANLQIVLFPNAGQLFFYTESKAVLSTVLSD